MPEIATGHGVVYSFQDVLALRTFVRLREDASLQKIRAAIGNLRDIGEVDHLASYRLVSDKGGNIQLVAEDEAVNLGNRPGHLQLVAVMGDIIEPFAARAGVLSASSASAAPRSGRRPGDPGRHARHRWHEGALRRGS